MRSEEIKPNKYDREQTEVVDLAEKLRRATGISTKRAGLRRKCSLGSRRNKN